MIQVAGARKGETNKWLSNMRDIQLRLMSRYNASRWNNPLVTVLSNDNKVQLDTFPHTINNYQPVTEHHYV